MATQARLGGDPEWLVKFEHGVASEGPRSVGQMLSEWEDTGASVGEFAETLSSRCVKAAHEVATEALPEALDRWESMVLKRARQIDGAVLDPLAVLADIGAMLDFVDSTLRTVGPPTRHDPDSYFIASPVSGGIEASAAGGISFINRLRERVRTGLALFSAVSTSRALELARQTQSSSERFQRVASVLGAVILGPSIVTGVYGANTELPGKDTSAGFVIMVGAVILSALPLLGILRWLGAPSETKADWAF
jgi:hypothetical protein